MFVHTHEVPLIVYTYLASFTLALKVVLSKILHQSRFSGQLLSSYILIYDFYAIGGQTQSICLTWLAVKIGSS